MDDDEWLGPGHATPEEAAREGTPVRFVRVVGAVIRGDRAIVAQRMNDRPMYEVDTSSCVRGSDGLWHEESSGNGTGGLLPTAPGRATVVGWEDDAPSWAVAARYACSDREAVVPVVDECVFCVFDDIEVGDDYLFGEWAYLIAWVREDGSEEASGRHRPTSEQRARTRAILDRLHEQGSIDPDDPLLDGGLIIFDEPYVVEPDADSPGES